MECLPQVRDSPGARDTAVYPGGRKRTVGELHHPVQCDQCHAMKHLSRAGGPESWPGVGKGTDAWTSDSLDSQRSSSIISSYFYFICMGGCV